MKYYIYMSQTKVEMLYPQIPPSFFKDVGAEIKVNLGVVSTTLKGNPASPPTELPEKLDIVCRYIGAHEQVGTIEEPQRYIAGILPLRYGIVWEYAADIAFFGGVIDKRTVGLIGSSESLVGQAQRTEAQHDLFYYTLAFLNEMAQSGEKTSEQVPYSAFREATEVALKYVPAATHNLDFLAKVLHLEEGLVVATPLYVAMAD